MSRAHTTGKLKGIAPPGAIADFRDRDGRAPAYPLERLIFFSDGVFAIAITLLIIEIKVPHLPHGSSNAAHLQALADLLPNFAGFLLSFAVIGAFWSGHHRAFSLASHYAPGLTIPNLTMLGAVAFMPFGSAYLSENTGSATAAVFYNGLLFVIGVLNLRLVRKVTGAPYVDERAGAAEIAYTRARGWGVTLGALCALIASFFIPAFSQMLLMTIPLWMRMAIARATRGLARTEG